MSKIFYEVVGYDSLGNANYSLVTCPKAADAIKESMIGRYDRVEVTHWVAKAGITSVHNGGRDGTLREPVSMTSDDIRNLRHAIEADESGGVK